MVATRHLQTRDQNIGQLQDEHPQKEGDHHAEADRLKTVSEGSRLREALS